MTSRPAISIVASLGPPPLPREHGAWAMLAIPLMIGLAVAPAAAALCVAFALVLGYLGRAVLVPAIARRRSGRAFPAGQMSRAVAWSAIYLTAALGCFVVSLLALDPVRRRATLLAATVPILVGAGHAFVGMAGHDRTLPAEMLGMLGLACNAPLVAAAGGQPVDRRSVGLVAIGLLYSLSSLSFVRAYRRRKSHGRIDTSACVGAHAALSAAFVTLFGWGALPAAAMLTLAPVLVRTTWGLWRPARDLRAVGWREFGVAAAFAATAVVGLRL